jgi:hypothetical protein
MQCGMGATRHAYSLTLPLNYEWLKLANLISLRFSFVTALRCLHDTGLPSEPVGYDSAELIIQ